MKKALELILTYKKVILIVTLMAGVIFGLLPQISFFGYTPLSTSLWQSITFCIVLLYICLPVLLRLFGNRKPNIKPSKLIYSVSDCVKKSYFNIKSFIALQTISFRNKLSQDLDDNSLYSKPWFLITGSPESGKKTLIKYSHLMPYPGLDNSFDVKSITHQFPSYTWRFSNDAIFFNPDLTDTKNSVTSLKRLFKILKSRRPKQPLNGVIVSISLVELVTMPDIERKALIRKFSEQIHTAHKTLSTKIPVFFVLTKADYVSGFIESFADLSQDELKQIWGLNFDLDTSDDLNQISNQFNHKYDLLIDKLRYKMSWLFEIERDSDSRKRVFLFPQQMGLLRTPILNLINELFSFCQYPKSIQLRGIFFTSNEQHTKQSHNFVSQLLYDNMIVEPKGLAMQKNYATDSYFTRSFFNNILLPESKHLGKSNNNKKFDRLYQFGLKLGFPFVILLSLIIMFNGYTYNQKQFIKIQNQVTHSFSTALKNIDPKSSLPTVILPALTVLNNSQNNYIDNKPLGSHMLYSSAKLNKELRESQQHFLNTYYMPRIATIIERSLKKGIDDNNVLYATLRAYLAFNQGSSIGPTSINSIMDAQWDKQYIKSPKTLAELKKYLAIATRHNVPSFPLDYALVNTTKDKLNLIEPTERAYGLLTLSAQTQLLTPLYIGKQISDQQNYISFSKTSSIPGLYTNNGYTQVYLSDINKITKMISRDNIDLGLGNGSAESTYRLKQSIYTRYSDNFIDNWDKNLNVISLSNIHDINQLILVCSGLSSNSSSLEKLSVLIKNNISHVGDTDALVHSHYNKLISFANSSRQMSQLKSSIGDIADLLKMINSAKHPNQKSFEFAIKAVKGSNNPITSLSIQAKDLPQPFKRIVNEIAMQAWRVVLNNAKVYMNSGWSNVYSEYQNHIQNYYPIKQTATMDVSINNFNEIFSPGGILDKYFVKYIDPFIDDKTGKPFHVGNIDSKLSNDLLSVSARLKSIHRDYYPNKSKVAGFNLSIKPQTLSPSLRSIKIVMGNISLLYRHGPLIQKEIKWPLSNSSNNSAMLATNFSDHLYDRSYSGPWSLFKLIGTMDITKNSKTNHYEASANFDKHEAVFTIDSSNPDLFTLHDLVGLTLPQTIS